MRLERADIRLVFAASGHGKSHAIKKWMRGQRRVMVWDVMAEYPGTAIDSRAALVDAVSRARFRVAFRPDFARGLAADFDFFCRAAFAAGRCMVIVEELNQVTTPSYAPPAWRNITSRGRHRGLVVCAASQRPAGCDKDAIGNATEIWAGRLPYERDRKALEPQLGRERCARLISLPQGKFEVWKA